MKKVMLILILVVCLAGCTAPQKPPVWGEGELSPDWVKMFGDGNPSRLCKALADQGNKHETHLYGTNEVKAGKKIHNYGLIDLVVAIDGRVKVLEAVDPNESETGKPIGKLRTYKDADFVYGWRLDVENKINEIIDRLNGVEAKDE